MNFIFKESSKLRDELEKVIACFALIMSLKKWEIIKVIQRSRKMLFSIILS